MFRHIVARHASKLAALRPLRASNRVSRLDWFNAADETRRTEPVWGAQAELARMRRPGTRERRLEKEKGQDEHQRPAVGKASARPRDGVALSTRQVAFTENIRRSLSNIFAHETLRDVSLRSVPILISSVSLSRDRRRATVQWDYDDAVTPVRTSSADVDARLQRAAPYIRSLLSQRMYVRHVPELIFERDRTEAQEASVEAALRAGHPTDYDQLAAQLESLESALVALAGPDKRTARRRAKSAERGALPHIETDPAGRWL